MNERAKKLVEEAEELVGNATAGPWNVRTNGKFVSVHTNESQINGWVTRKPGDASFIAFSREAVPALCAEVRRLDEERERLRAEVRDLRSVSGAFHEPAD